MNDSELIKNIIKNLELEMKEEIIRDMENLIKKVDLLNKKAIIDRNIRLEIFSRFLLAHLQLTHNYIIDSFGGT